MKLLNYGTSCCVRSTTIMRGCVTCNNLWSWPISSRSLSHNFTMKLLNYGTYCCVRFTCTVLYGFFPHLALMITNMRGCVVHNDLWPWPISSRSFNHNFAIKLLKYGTSCCICSTACKVLDGFFPYLALMITSMRGCVECNDLWTWPISSRLFSCDLAYLMDHIHMWHKYNPWGDDVSRTISRSIGQKVKILQVIRIFAVGQRVSLWITDLQFLVWTSAGISFKGPFVTNFNEVRIKIHWFSFNKLHLKMPAKEFFCLNSLNVLRPLFILWWKPLLLTSSRSVHLPHFLASWNELIV